jgi:hypothetical protein
MGKSEGWLAGIVRVYPYKPFTRARVTPIYARRVMIPASLWTGPVLVKDRRTPDILTDTGLGRTRQPKRQVLALFKVLSGLSVALVAVATCHRRCGDVQQELEVPWHATRT